MYLFPPHPNSLFLFVLLAHAPPESVPIIYDLHVSEPRVPLRLASVQGLWHAGMEEPKLPQTELWAVKLTQAASVVSQALNIKRIADLIQVRL